MKSVALHNLGCKVNSYEMDVMQQYLQENGYEIVEFDQKADIYIINTCTVTNIADRKSRQMIHRAKKQNRDAIVVAVGCYVQTAGEEALMDECIDLAIGNNKKKDLVAILDSFLKQKETYVPDMKTLHNTIIIDVRHTAEYEDMQLEKTSEHTRAYIKIQDGCDQFCSYCVIPYARGKVRSRKPDEVLREVKTLAKRGYKEVVLTGIHLSSYGLDFEGRSYNQVYKETDRQDARFKEAAGHLLALIEKIHEVEGITRIRLGSLEPRIITKTFVERLARLKKVCPHFHLSLQSGSDSVLKRMNRRYSTQDFLDGVALLREVYAHPAITTDVITGFPGESEEEFAQTVSFVKRVHFYEMHVFPYSKRKGTVAADMKGQLSEKQKKERSSVLIKLDEVDSNAFRSYYKNKQAEVLFEQEIEMEGERYQVGHTRDYVKVAVKTEQDLINKEVLCQVGEVCKEAILFATV